MGVENEMVNTKSKVGGENEKVNNKPIKVVSRAPVDIAHAKNNDKTIHGTYQKKTQLEHILLWLDTYVGSIEKHT